jgi:DHA1 family bicyclomycin/chloramphenicol resistance-like MFS transporter
MTALMTPHLRRMGLMLGLLSVIGGLGIDMYLPAMPMMAQDLHAPIGSVQLSLTAFLLAIAIGQPFYGPLSDAIGRKPPLAIGMLVFGLASVGCALARDVDRLILFRFAQGLGASATMVVSRAMVRDLCTGPTAIKLLAIMIAVVGVAPVASPVVGGLVVEHFSWRVLFHALWIMALGGMFLILFVLPETRPPQDRIKGGVRHLALAARELIADRRFVGLIILPGLTQAATFAFVANSAFVFVELLSLSPAGYSLIFAATAVALIGGAQLSGGAVQRFGPERVILTAVTLYVIAALTLLTATLSGHLSLLLVCGVFLTIFASSGFIGSPASVLALEPHARISGTAAALGGAAQMALSAAGSGIASAFTDGTALPLALTMSVAAILALIVGLRVLTNAPSNPSLENM